MIYWRQGIPRRDEKDFTYYWISALGVNHSQMEKAATHFFWMGTG